MHQLIVLNLLQILTVRYTVQLNQFNSSAKVLILLASLSSSFSLLAGEPIMLVSEQEYLLQMDKKNKPNNLMKPLTRSSVGTNKNAPVITINSPMLTSGLLAPIKIAINFKAHDDANIEIDSLRVLYGWLNLDITDRIKKHAQITNSGISATNVMLPEGEHNITIQIMDTRARSAEKEISFEILEH
jgi:hypothetical protein